VSTTCGFADSTFLERKFKYCAIVVEGGEGNYSGIGTSTSDFEALKSYVIIVPKLL